MYQIYQIVGISVLNKKYPTYGVFGEVVFELLPQNCCTGGYLRKWPLGALCTICQARTIENVDLHILLVPLMYYTTTHH